MATVTESKPAISVEAKPVLATTNTVSVFSKGPYSVAKPKTVSKPWFCSSPPKSLFIVFPEEQGTYQVIMFFSGTSLANTSYSNLYDHMASHGFIVVAPQLYDLMPPKGNQEVKDAAEVMNWLITGLQSELPANVEANLNDVALMGHSRGGLVAFALAQQGYPKTDMKFSAIVGIDPVAGLSDVKSELDPPILNHQSFNFTIPVTVIGTGLGGVIKFQQPCAPEGKNHEQFFIRCTSSDRAHFDAKDYGHMDVLDDPKAWEILKYMCTNGTLPRDPMRRCVGGIAVAFLKAYFNGDVDDFMSILKDPTVAPITLDKAEFIQPPPAEASTKA